MKPLIQYFLFLFFILSLFCPNFCYEYTTIKNYETISISLTLEKPYAIFQYKNNPYQPNTGSILLQFRIGKNNKCVIYIYKSMSDINETSTGVFINYYKSNDMWYSNTTEFTNINSGTYYIVISSPNYNYRDTFLIYNGYEYYELKQNEIIFTNLTETYRGTRYFYFKTPNLSETKYFHILGYFTRGLYTITSSQFSLAKNVGGEPFFSTTDSNYNFLFKLEPNNIYTANFQIYSENHYFHSLNFALYYSNYGRVEPLDKYTTLSIPILSEGMYYYFHINIEPYELNELIYFKFNSYYQNKIKLYGTFYKTSKLDDIENNLPNSTSAKDIVTILSTSNGYTIAYVKKINTSDKSLVIFMNNYNVQKDSNLFFLIIIT